MPAANRAAANRRNAQKSTGPRTPAGKRRAAQNPITHGLRTVSAVLPDEDPAVWEQFEAAVRADLRPVGAVEAELAGRVATLLWRLRRVTTFEVAAAVHPDPAQPPRFGYTDPKDLTRARRAVAGRRRVPAHRGGGCCPVRAAVHTADVRRDGHAVAV